MSFDRTPHVSWLDVFALAHELDHVVPAMPAVRLASANHQHQYSQQPGKDGRIYMVCSCGHSFALGGSRPGQGGGGKK